MFKNRCLKPKSMYKVEEIDYKILHQGSSQKLTKWCLISKHRKGGVEYEGRDEWGEKQPMRHGGKDLHSGEKQHMVCD